MQAVLLMAGKGTRMAKYYEGPKQLLPLNGKPILEHTLAQLPDDINELLFVVGGPHEARIRDHFKTGEYMGRPITFVVQKEQLGMAHAFRCAQPYIKGQWLGMVADDLVGPTDIASLWGNELALLAYRVPNPEKFGVLVADEERNLVRALEKPKEFVSNLVWTGHMLMDESFFATTIDPSVRGEYETPDVWMKLVTEHGKKIKVVEAKFWLPINDKEQLEQAERILREQAT